MSHRNTYPLYPDLTRGSYVPGHLVGVAPSEDDTLDDAEQASYLIGYEAGKRSVQRAKWVMHNELWIALLLGYLIGCVSTYLGMR